MASQVGNAMASASSSAKRRGGVLDKALTGAKLGGAVMSSKPGKRLWYLLGNTLTSYFALQRVAGDLKSVKDRPLLLKLISLTIGIALYRKAIAKDPLGGHRYNEKIAAIAERGNLDFMNEFPMSLQLAGPHMNALAAASKQTRDAYKQNYIFAAHPHGAGCVFTKYMHMCSSHDLAKIVPRSKRRMAGAEIFSVTPFLREITNQVGTVSASRESLVECLKQGYSVEILPGGEREMLLTEYKVDSIFVSHKGFIKLAIETGTPIVPIYVFGEVDTFELSNAFLKQRQWLSRKAQIAIPFMKGEGFLDPFRVPLTIVVGDPIHVERCSPSKELVDAVHGQYVQALIDLFESNKHRFGYGDRELKVVGEWEKPTRASNNRVAQVLARL